MADDKKRPDIDEVNVEEAPDLPGTFETNLAAPGRGVQLGIGSVRTDAPAAASGAFALSSGAAYRTIPVYPVPVAGGPISSMHTEAVRWIKIHAYVLNNDQTEVPLIDASGRPIADPSFPPMSILRRAQAPTDLVTMGSLLTPWEDLYCTMAKPTTPDWKGHFSSVTFRLERSPRPHWVAVFDLAFEDDSGGFAGRTLMCDLLTNGYGEHDVLEFEDGTANQSGHYRWELVWEQQGFNSAPLKNPVHQRAWCSGKWWIATGATTATVYLQSPDGAFTDSALFKATTLPAVRVWRMGGGNGDLNLPVPTDPPEGNEQTWRSMSEGLGVDKTSSTAYVNPAMDFRAFGSNLRLSSGVWRLDIANYGSLGMPFYISAWGIDVGST